jgi:lysophospholipase L1-like esterase
MNRRSVTRLALALSLALLPLSGPSAWAADPVAVASPERPPAAPPFAAEIAAFEASDRTNPPPKNGILFLGSSSIRLWKTLAADFPGYPVFNRGFGGSQIRDSIRYFDRIVLPYRPRLIVFYAGGNDINAKRTPDQVFQDYQAFAHRVLNELPETRLAYISIAPNPARWAQIEQVRAANQKIAAFTKTNPRLFFLDAHPQMLGPNGQPKPDIFVEDRLHMNDAGYRLWTRIVSAYFAEHWPASTPASDSPTTAKP